jgi:WS/DGAT/MGAT family acyltransferase
VPDVVRAFGTMFGAREGLDKMETPFSAPNSILNGRIKGPRRFATQQFELARLKRVADAAGATLNDVVLALCGSALRKFLGELGELPEQSLTAGIPVSVRPKDDEGTGNAITFIISTLGTDIEDARERLAAIRASTRNAKEHVAALPKQAMMQYTMVLMAPYMLSLVAGIGGRTRPMFNVTISNVPGPSSRCISAAHAWRPRSRFRWSRTARRSTSPARATPAPSRSASPAAATRCPTCSASRPTRARR